MSEIKVNSIVDASGGSTVQVNGYTPTVSNMAGRNRIINGDMRIDARNAGAAITITTGTFGVDRFRQTISGGFAGATSQQVSDAPAGFVNSLKWTVTSPASATTNNQCMIQQRFEGYNFADLNFGTANAKNITVSFWVKSSVTGTYCASLFEQAGDRSYVSEYTINSANTWEYKTVTITGDTSGTWPVDNTSAGQINFSLGSGPDRVAPAADTWYAAGYLQTSNQVNWINTSGATFYITGVQLEAGSVATPFEHRQYGQELALCQRYFQNAKYGINGVAFGVSNTYSGGDRVFLCGGSEFKVDMRAQPDMTLYSAQTRTPGQVSGYSSGTDYVVSSISSPDNRRIGMYLQLSSSPPVFDTLAFYFDASAEL